MSVGFRVSVADQAAIIFRPRDRGRVKESEHRRLAEAPSSLMLALPVVVFNPGVEIRLQVGDARIAGC
jgi:hypothetical protein